MKTPTQKLEDFINDDNTFIYKLRNYEGLDKESLNQFMNILDEIGVSIANNIMIEKKLTYLLLDTVPLLLSLVENYKDSEKDEILLAIDQIENKLGEIFYCE